MLVFCLMIVLHVTAQDTADTRIPLAAGEAQIIRLNGDNRPVLLAYETVSPGSTITVTARSLEAEDMVDTVLMVIGPNARRLAYSDNHRSDLTGLQATDSAITGLILTDAGIYTIWVSSYGGIGVGDVEVLVNAVNIFRAQVTETEGGVNINGYLPPRLAYEYAFYARTGDVFTITARDQSGSLDLRLLVTTVEGEVVAENDDHASRDLTLNVLDARIADFIVPQTDTYIVVVLDMLGRPGNFNLTVIPHDAP